MAPGSRSEGLTTMVLPVITAMGMHQRGIMAGKSEVVSPVYVMGSGSDE